jgi:hypothetical protein
MGEYYQIEDFLVLDFQKGLLNGRMSELFQVYKTVIHIIFIEPLSYIVVAEDATRKVLVSALKEHLVKWLEKLYSI